MCVSVGGKISILIKLFGIHKDEDNILLVMYMYLAEGGDKDRLLCL